MLLGASVINSTFKYIYIYNCSSGKRVHLALIHFEALTIIFFPKLFYSKLCVELALARQL